MYAHRKEQCFSTLAMYNRLPIQSFHVTQSIVRYQLRKKNGGSVKRKNHDVQSYLMSHTFFFYKRKKKVKKENIICQFFSYVYNNFPYFAMYVLIV
jgi:hypothetical protein